MKAETIVIQTSSTSSTKFALGDIPNLRGKKIVAVEAHNVSQVPTSPLNRALVNSNVWQQSYLTLSVKGKEAINQVPLNAFYPTNNGGQLKSIAAQEIDTINSFVSVPNTTGLVSTESYLFTFYYID